MFDPVACVVLRGGDQFLTIGITPEGNVRVVHGREGVNHGHGDARNVAGEIFSCVEMASRGDDLDNLAEMFANPQARTRAGLPAPRIDGRYLSHDMVPA